MSYVQADIDAMDTAIKRGVKTVTMESGQSIEYRSMDELIKARNLAVQEVSRDNAKTAGVSSRYSLARFIK